MVKKQKTSAGIPSYGQMFITIAIVVVCFLIFGPLLQKMILKASLSAEADNMFKSAKPKADESHLKKQASD